MKFGLKELVIAGVIVLSSIGGLWKVIGNPSPKPKVENIPLICYSVRYWDYINKWCSDTDNGTCCRHYHSCYDTVDDFFKAHGIPNYRNRSF